ncbi:MAG: alpha-(1-_3)-arabinofuranosyltransferase domain-containing protein, partial [Aquihabitans sp.]
AGYRGAGDVLVRNDHHTVDIGGPAPWVVAAQVAADPGLEHTASYGRRGSNTVPGERGRATKKIRRTDPDDASLRPISTYEVLDPTPPITAAPAANQVLAVGDGQGVPALIKAGIVDGSQPIRYLGELNSEEFADAVDRGGRVVLTDTNRRRAWDINRVANATSDTLRAGADIDAGNGSTTTLWPDHPDDQTVSQLTGGVRIGASRDGFGLHPYGRPSNAFDGDPSTAWIAGGFGTARGKSVWIDFPKPRLIDEITITPWAGASPSTVSAVRVEVGDKQVTEALVPGQDLKVGIEPSTAERVKVTILEQTDGDNPVGISDITIDDVNVRNLTRAPKTLSRLADKADAATREKLAAMPLDVVFTREQGSYQDPNDDEEAQLDRVFELPDARTFTFTASLGVAEADDAVVAAARNGDRSCQRVAVIDGEWIEARVVSSRAELATGQMRIEGCAPIDLEAGGHQLQTVYQWRLNTVRFASEGTVEPVLADPADRAVTITDRSATEIDMQVAAAASGSRYLRLGEAYDDRWTLSVDGVDAGPPILVDGYSTGWLIDAKAHRLVATFGPQGAVRATFAASAVAVVGVTAIALLPAPAVLQRRRRRSVEPAAAPPAGGAP